MNPPEVQSVDAFRQSRGLLVVFFCLAAVIAYMQRTAIGGAASLIQDSLGVSKARFGLIMSMYYWAYAVGQIPAALLIRRIGTGRALSLSVGLASVFAAATALSGSWQLFAVLWLLTGVSIAGIFPACVRSIATAFPAGHRAFPSGALTSAMSVGGGISSAMTGRMIQWLTGIAADPWRWVFLIYAIPGVIWAFVFYGWYREPVGQ
jgi:MFS family permease